MLRIVFIVLTTCMSLLTGRLVASDQPQTEFIKVRTEYADVLALQGTAKGEILAIARLLRANPKMAVDQTVIRGCLGRVQQTRSKPRTWLRPAAKFNLLLQTVRRFFCSSLAGKV
jgi:hypothetical protein